MEKRIIELIKEYMYRAAAWGSEQDPAVMDQKAFDQNFKDYAAEQEENICDDVSEVMKEEFQAALDDYIKEARKCEQ